MWKNKDKLVMVETEEKIITHYSYEHW
jgi:hypothetical protein